MRAYFDESKANSNGARLVTLFMLALGIVGLVLAEQVLTGWLAIGERANIPRSNLNFWEWIVIIGAAVFGIACLRTARGLFSRERASWSWSQWMSFITAITGFALLMSVLVPIVIKAATNSPNIRAPQNDLLIPGLILLVMGLAAYFITGGREEASDEHRRAISLAPTRTVQVQLAKSPSAGAIIGFIAIFLFFTMATDLFLQPTSIASILTNVSTKGIMAIGVTILMISGEFDLSVGSIMGVISMAFMVFMTEGIPGLNTGPVPEFLAAILALLVAVVLGAINGVLLVTTRIPSFIVTLGTLLAFRAITLVVIAGGRILRYRDYFNDFPQVYINSLVMVALALVGLAVMAFVAYRSLPMFWSAFREKWTIRQNNGDFGTTSAIYSGLVFLVMAVAMLLVAVWLGLVATFHLENAGIVQVGFFDLANGRWGFTMAQVTRGAVEIIIPIDSNFRNSIIWWAIFVVVFHIILTRTRYGNAVFATGGNVGAARAQGINVDRVKVQNFILVAVLTGVAAIYEVARNPGVDPLKGQGWELDVIAMTVIGGALLSGGYGSIIGSLLGALIFGMLQTGLVLIGVDSRLFQGTVGVIIIVAVVLNTAVRGKRT